MSPPPAFSAGLRLLLCFGATVLFFVGMLFLGWLGETKKPNLISALETSGSQSGTEAFNTSDVKTTSPRDHIFISLAHKLRSHPPSESSVMSALEQLAQEPAEAVIVARRLMTEFPDQAVELGNIVIGALVRAAAYTNALELAQNGPEASRTEWITLVLVHWTQSRPEDAEFITNQLLEKGVTAATFALVTKSWASSAPAQLARYAITLPTGEHRSIALDSVLDPWIQQDPAAVMPWIGQLTDSAERDQALSRLVIRTDTAIRPTNQALAWAESIGDSALRHTALASVVREWFVQDPAAATRYIDSNQTFSQNQRQQIFASLAPPVDPP